ncbi:MAG: GNAT family N-acetyltransferase [Parachlamydiales bacterium]|jgi:GNAT superfamily N-acetyltransferase
MKIDYLKNHKNMIPILAKWNYSEWGHKTKLDLQDIEKKYEQTALTKQIPSTFVALINRTIVGMASLLAHDCKAEPTLTPWLAALYVDKDYRKQGIGKALVQKALSEAKKLNISILYLQTEEKNLNFYQELGWKMYKKTIWQKEEIIIMSFTIF